MTDPRPSPSPGDYKNQLPYGGSNASKVAFRREAVRLLDKLRSDLEAFHEVGALHVADRDLLWQRAVLGSADPVFVIPRYAEAVTTQRAESDAWTRAHQGGS